MTTDDTLSCLTSHSKIRARKLSVSLLVFSKYLWFLDRRYHKNIRSFFLAKRKMFPFGSSHKFEKSRWQRGMVLAQRWLFRIVDTWPRHVRPEEACTYACHSNVDRPSTPGSCWSLLVELKVLARLDPLFNVSSRLPNPGVTSWVSRPSHTLGQAGLRDGLWKARC